MISKVLTPRATFTGLVEFKSKSFHNLFLISSFHTVSSQKDFYFLLVLRDFFLRPPPFLFLPLSLDYCKESSHSQFSCFFHLPQSYSVDKYCNCFSYFMAGWKITNDKWSILEGSWHLGGGTGHSLFPVFMAFSLKTVQSHLEQTLSSEHHVGDQSSYRKPRVLLA